MSVPEWNLRKAKTTKESRRQDALRTPLESTRKPLRIMVYTDAEKKPQSAEMLFRMVKSGEQWLHVPCSKLWPVEMCACSFAVPRLGMAWANTGEMPGRMTTVAGEWVYGPIGAVEVEIMKVRGGPPCLTKMGCSGTMYPCLPGKEEAPRKRRHADGDPLCGLMDGVSSSGTTRPPKWGAAGWVRWEVRKK